jgi:hypothetical protein
MRRLAISTAAAAVLLFGCDQGPTNSADITGTYTLLSLNGAEVPRPVTVTDGGSTINGVHSGELSLRGDGSHMLALVVSRSGSAQLGSLIFTGDYERNGNALTLDLGWLGVRPASLGSSAGRRTVLLDAGSGFGSLSFRLR